MECGSLELGYDKAVGSRFCRKCGALSEEFA